MEGRHRSGAAKAQCIRGPAGRQEYWGGEGARDHDTSTGRQELARGGGRPEPSCLLIQTLRLLFFASSISHSKSSVFLNTTYISNNLNIQSDCESDPIGCKTSRVLQKEENIYVYSYYPKMTKLAAKENSDILETLLPHYHPVGLFDECWFILFSL